MHSMEGYPKISQLMGCQDECAIYRRFRNLNSLNLLYLQAELTHLEQDLQRLTERDARSLERRFYARDWLSLSQNDDKDEDAEQWDKFLEIRAKLEQYSVWLHTRSLPACPALMNHDRRSSAQAIKDR